MLLSFARQRATMGGSILRHDPLSSRAAASQGSVGVWAKARLVIDEVSALIGKKWDMPEDVTPRQRARYW